MKIQRLLLIAGLVCAATSTWAAEISWSVQNITGNESDISTAGSVVATAGGTGIGGTGVTGASVTVNGVEFFDNATMDSPNKFDDIGVRTGIPASGTYHTLLRFPDRNTGSANQSISLNGLTIGNTYQIQIWASDNNNGPVGEVAAILNDGTGSSPNPATSGHAALFYELTDGGPGQYAIGTFTADAASQQILWQRYSGMTTTPTPQGQQFVNAWQLRDLGVDSSPPTPDPMTWVSVPAAVNDSTITMTATTASDQNMVEYQFMRYAADGTSLLFTSPWQDSPDFTDTGLDPDTTYTYAVTARDKSPSQFATAPSTPVAPATTPALDDTPPSPDPMTWASTPAAVGYDTITMTATTATDANGVEYEFKRYAADGTTLLFTSPWQDSPEFTDTGLDPDTTYNYTVTARDKSASQNATAPSTPAAPATTDSKGSAIITWTAFDITNDVGNVSTAGTLVDARNGATSSQTVNGVAFEAVADSGNLFDSLFANDVIGNRGYGTVVTDANYRAFLTLGQRSGRPGFSDPPRIPPTEVWTTVEFFGLTIGNTYQIQLWASDVNAGTDTARNKVLVLGDGSEGDPAFGTDAQLFYEVSEGGAGQFGIGSFVANASNQAFNVRTYNNPLTSPSATNSDHFSNGWQLRDLGTVGPLSVDNSTVTASPASVPADGNTTSTITVTLKDDVGTPIPGKIVSLTGNTGNATVQTANSMSNGAGIVTFTVQSNIPGTEQFTATVDSETITQIASVTFIPTATLVIDLGTSPTGTFVSGGSFIGTGPTNLPIPALPAGSILRSVAVNAKLEATSSANLAADLTVLLDTTMPTSGDDFSLAMISSSATANFSPSESLFWTTGDGEVGTSLTETKINSQWTGDIDLATTAMFLGNGYTAGDGTWSGTITLTFDDVSGGGSGYASWSGGEPFDEDKNGDGVANGVAFVLGAPDPDADALGLLPTVTEDSGGLVLTFQMLDAAARGGASLALEYSSTLAVGSWTSVTVPDTSTSVDDVVFTITGTGPLGVTATIPDSKAAGGKLFGRFKAMETAP